MRNREELEQLFAECKEVHEKANKAYRGLLITGPLAVVLCGIAGVTWAFRGRPVFAFLEFLLGLWVGVNLWRSIKRNEERQAHWAEFEVNHNIMMNILDVMEKENNYDEGNDECT